MAEKKKIKRTRLFKTNDYIMALHYMAKRLIEAKPDIKLEITPEELATLPSWQKLLYKYTADAIANAKFQQKEIL